MNKIFCRRNKNQTFNKGFSILAVVETIILLAIVAVLGLIAYDYFYPAPIESVNETKQQEELVDETVDWQTYINYDYRFQIKYPADWQLSTPNDIKDRIVFIAPATQPKFFDFEIKVEKNTDKLLVKDFVANMLTQNAKQEIGKISYKNTQEMVIAELPAYELNEVFAYDQNQEWIYLAKGENVFRFAFSIAETNPNLEDPIENNRISHLMLSTFAFLDQSSIDKEKACVDSGGKVVSVTCYCSSSADFYNNCAIGGCTCTPNPEFAKDVKNCECPEGKCFNGVECVGQSL